MEIKEMMNRRRLLQIGIVIITALLMLCTLSAAAAESSSLVTVTVYDVSISVDKVVSDAGYSVNGEIGKTSVVVLSGDVVTITVNPLPAGCSLKPEYTGTAVYSQTGNTITVKNIKSDIFIRLSGGKPAYVTFNANGGVGTMSAQEFLTGLPAVLNKNTFEPAAGWKCKKFAGWAETADGSVKYTDGQKITVTKDITLYAVWNTVHTVETVAGKEATCTEDGHTAWSHCSVCGEVFTPAVTIKAAGHKPADPVRENEVKPTAESDGSYDEVIRCSVCNEVLDKKHVVVPKIVPETVWKVTYYAGTADAGSVPVDEKLYAHKAEVTVADKHTLSKTGCSFTGWKNATDVIYQAGNTFTITEDTALYAQWNPIHYTIAFNANGGTGAPDAIEAVYDEEKILPETTGMQYTGYAFGGWALSADGGAKYAAGTNVKNLAAENGATVTLYAVWNKVEHLKVVEKAEESTEYPDEITIVKIDEGTITKDDEQKTATILNEKTGEKVEVFVEYENTPKVDPEEKSVTGKIRVFDLYYDKKLDLTPTDTQKSGENAKAEIKYEMSRLTDAELEVLKDTPKLTAGLTTDTNSGELEKLASTYKVAGVVSGTLEKEEVNDKLKKVGMTVTFTLNKDWVEKRYGNNLNDIKTKIKVVHIPDSGASSVIDYKLSRDWNSYIIEYISYDGFSSHAVLCAPVYYTVSFKLNGGHWAAAGTPNEKSILEDTSIPSDEWRVPVKENDAFIDWYTDAGLTHPYNKAAPVTKSFTLYAKWENGVSPTPTPTYSPSHSSSGGTSIILQPATNPTAVPTTSPLINPEQQPDTIYVNGDDTSDGKSPYTVSDITAEYYGIPALNSVLSTANALDLLSAANTDIFIKELKSEHPEMSDAELQRIAETFTRAADAGVITKTVNNAPVLLSGTTVDKSVVFYHVYDIEAESGSEAVNRIDFAVPLADIAAAEMTERDVIMYHGFPEYNVWVPLDTYLAGVDETHAYYSAYTQSASPFAVVFMKDMTLVPGESFGQKYLWLILIIAAAVLIAGIITGVCIRQHRKKTAGFSEIK